ncbi:hypothetical protein [Stenotrophomonas sp. CFBP 13718]|uniref:hypothetical protein n=1 Tax=Stenotrophomonas sp. CFBP 13718 TaxID=2775304 RepID=UPI00177EF0A2|nr:hypothetical protein [Stenotrophomonas sp. CFBP 13718]MBD8696636.1 hypothetical protein [Stenotrophomonas sp. CFBP 13718]
MTRIFNVVWNALGKIELDCVSGTIRDTEKVTLHPSDFIGPDQLCLREIKLHGGIRRWPFAAVIPVHLHANPLFSSASV